MNDFTDRYIKNIKSRYAVIIKYIIVGGFATLIDFSIFFILANIFDMYYILSNTISFSISLILNYFISREWVFEKKHHNFKKDFTLYVITSVMGLAINNIIIFILVDFEFLKSLINLVVKFNNENIIKLLSKMVATIIVLIWNYITKKYYVFKN